MRNDIVSETRIHEKKRTAEVVIGIVFGIMLLFLSDIILSFSYSDTSLPSDPIQAQKYVLDYLMSDGIMLILIVGIGILGAVACITAFSSVKRDRHSAVATLGYTGSSIILFTVLQTLFTHNALITYHPIIAFLNSAVALICAALGFIGSATIKDKNLRGSVLLFISAGVVLIVIFIQTLVFIGAGSLLLIIGGILANIKEKPNEESNLNSLGDTSS